MGLFDFLKKSNKSDVELYYEERNMRANPQNQNVTSPVNNTANACPHMGFNMTVDDVFSITGRGTVVTGCVELGSINVGDTVVLQRVDGSTRNVTITGIEKFRKKLNSAQQGDNVGLLLQGLTRHDIARGDLLLK